MNYDRLTASDRELRLILELVDAIRKVYRRIQEVNGTEREVVASDTLATKIILGSIGCLPAYDRYVCCGMRRVGLPYSCLNKKHLERLLNFYQQNADAFKQAQIIVSRPGLTYPIMKLVDMYLWTIGNEN